MEDPTHDSFFVHQVLTNIITTWNIETVIIKNDNVSIQYKNKYAFKSMQFFWMRENADQNNSEYGPFLHSDHVQLWCQINPLHGWMWLHLTNGLKTVRKYVLT